MNKKKTPHERRREASATPTANQTTPRSLRKTRFLGIPSPPNANSSMEFVLLACMHKRGRVVHIARYCSSFLLSLLSLLFSCFPSSVMRPPISSRVLRCNKQTPGKRFPLLSPPRAYTRNSPRSLPRRLTWHPCLMQYEVKAKRKYTKKNKRSGVGDG